MILFPLWKCCSTFTKFQQKIHKKEAKIKHRSKRKRSATTHPYIWNKNPPYSKSYLGEKKTPRLSPISSHRFFKLGLRESHAHGWRGGPPCWYDGVSFAPGLPKQKPPKELYIRNITRSSATSPRWNNKIRFGNLGSIAGLPIKNPWKWINNPGKNCLNQETEASLKAVANAEPSPCSNSFISASICFEILANIASNCCTN